LNDAGETYVKLKGGFEVMHIHLREGFTHPYVKYYGELMQAHGHYIVLSEMLSPFGPYSTEAAAIQEIEQYFGEK
jgi:hypothetical protein